MLTRVSVAIWLVCVLGAAWQVTPDSSASQPAPTGQIVFYGGSSGDLEVYSISAQGGAAENLTDFPSAADASPAWSPDRTKVVFQSNRADGGGLGNFRIWVMNADGSNPQPIVFGSSASWSPDGERIVYQCQSSICVVDADGSNQQTILTSPDESYFGPAWSPDGTRIAAASLKINTPGGIITVNPQGGDRVDLTSDRGSNPSWSPGGTQILYLIDSTQDFTDSLHVVTVSTKATEMVVAEAYGGGGWSPDGEFIAYGRLDDGLWIANADGSSPVQITQLDAIDPHWAPDRLVHSVEFTQAIQEWQTISALQASLGGGGQPVGGSGTDAGGTIFYNKGGGVWSVSVSGGPPTQINMEVPPPYHMWDVSLDGSKLLIASSGVDAPLIWVVGSDGSGAQHVADGWEASWAPDGERFAYRCGEDGYVICAIDADGSNSRVVYDPVQYEQLYDLDWGVNDKIVFGFLEDASGQDPFGFAVIDANGGAKTNILFDVHPEGSPAWSPAGNEILYSEGGAGIHVISPTGAPIRTVTTNADASQASWSSDGSQIVFTQFNQASVVEIWVASADGSNAHVIPGTTGATGPRWVGEPAQVHSVEFTQAIQEWQTISALQSDLEADGQPPVPLVAGKTTAMRVYFNELAEERTFIVDSNLSEDDVRTEQSAGCAPEATRRGEDICASADFFFEPPEGEWTAEIFIKDTSGEVLEEYSFEFNTPKAPELVLVAVSICDLLEEGTWYCGDESTLASNVRLLRRMAPTHEVRVVESRHSIRRNFSGSGDEEGEAWWQLVLDDLSALSGRFPADLVVPGERRMYVGVVREEGPEGLSGQAELGGLVMTAREKTISLGREDTQDTVAHEAAHVLNVSHTNSGVPDADEAPGCYAVAQSEGTDWPYGDNLLRSGPAPGVIEVGFNTFESDILRGDTVFEISGYCGPSWISPRTSRLMLDGLDAPLLGTGGDATPQGASGDFWLVSGRVENGTATFNPLFEFASESSTAAGQGDHRLEVRDSADAVLFARNFTLTESGVRPEPGFNPSEPPPSFSEMIPVQGGAASIAVVGPGETVLGQIDLTGAAPSVSFGTLPIAPVSGSHAISWTITDTDSTEHTTWLEYSPDSGATWNAIAVGLEEDSLQVNFDELPGGNQALLRVTVSDGVNTGSATSQSLAVAEKGPRATIINPGDGGDSAEGNVVSLEGAAVDPDDGTLEGAAVTWTSSRDGALGQGPNLVAYDLSVGVHTITLTARDSDNNTAADSITITVGEPTGDEQTWGDNDCNGSIGSRDGQALSRLVLSQNPLSQTQPCPALGSSVTVGGTSRVWGDIDCNGTIGARDGQALLRNVLGQAPLSQTQPCPAIGEAVTVAGTTAVWSRRLFG